VKIVGHLREKYGLEKRPVKVIEPYQMLGLVEDDLMEQLSLDVIGISPRKNMIGFENCGWKEFVAPWGQQLLVPQNFNTRKEGEYVYIFPEGDMGVPASAKMPLSGFFFDTIVRQQPIDETALDPEDNLEEFGIMGDEDIEYFRREIGAAAKTTKGVIANFGGTGFGDIALVPGPFMKNPKGIRDIAEWYMSTVSRRDYIHAIFEKQLDYALANMEKVFAAIGNSIDVVFICGTDFGTQQGSFCSRETFKELWMPYYSKLNQWIHNNTTWKTFKHCCGSVRDLLDLMIDSGFDIMNPVQCSAAGMDARELKQEFGDKLVFWGGGVDTQHTLPFGTPEDVRKEVLERCEIFGTDGGFVFNAIHNVQAHVPVENVVAMIDAVKEFNSVAV
jgi:hypothetical protein